MMKIKILCTFLLTTTLSNFSLAQIATSDQTSDFHMSKLSYIDACMDTYEESENACACTFEYMKNNYKVRFFEDDAFLNDDHQEREQLLVKMTESLQVCTAMEHDEFSYPRSFEMSTEY